MTEVSNKEEILRQDLARDIVAARAEISGRRDQLLAEYDERLAALESLAASLRDGGSESRATQAGLRRLLSEKSRSSLKAGRTTIGMSVPKPTSAISTRSVAAFGPGRGKTNELVGKALGEIDRALIAVLSTTRGADARQEARLEVSLLQQLRRSLEYHHGDLPNDVILLSSIVEFAQHVEQTLADLRSGGANRLGRLLDHGRSLVAQLAAMGVKVTKLKQSILEARELVRSGEGNLDALRKGARETFERLQVEMEKRFPTRDPTLLDDLLTRF